jgi:hypothetical protein
VNVADDFEAVRAPFRRGAGVVDGLNDDFK